MFELEFELFIVVEFMEKEIYLICYL